MTALLLSVQAERVRRSLTECLRASDLMKGHNR